MQPNQKPNTSGKRKAVIVGVGQERRNPKLDGPFEPHEPAEMMAEAIRRALADLEAQGGPGASDVLAQTQLLASVDPLAWGYHDLCANLAERLGLPSSTPGLMVPPGGNSPGDLLNQIMERMAEGSLDVALLSGAECVYARRKAMKNNMQLDWTPFEGHRDFLKGQRPLTNALETRHGITVPINCYPLYENAFRHDAGRSIAEHQTFLGTFMARNAAVAATNPYAWFPFAQTAEEIATVGPENRMVGFPYPKRMNAIMEVDMSAAVIVMSEEAADRLGVPESARVTVVGGAGAVDGWCPTERENFVSSPAIAAASAAALSHAGLAVDDIDLFDLYSCFPSAVQMALRELKVAADDPRGVTVTGGLAYMGGPGNNYALHGMAVMAQRLRNPADPATTGLVSSLGNTATKHAITVLSTDAEKIERASGRATPKVAVNINPPMLVDERSGEANVETYTVLFGREGEPTQTIYVLRFDDGTRTVANGDCSPEEVLALTGADSPEPIGRRGLVTAGSVAADADGVNTPNHFAFLGGA